MLYVDTSALVRAYMADEAEHDVLVELLRAGREMVATSSLTVVEAASAFALAVRMGRLTEREGRRLLDTLDHDLGPDGVIGVFTFDVERALARARLLLLRHPLRTLDALQLAIAEHEGQQLAAGEALVFVTRDQGQRDAAKALGFPLG
jgi:uncharacterized protein